MKNLLKLVAVLAMLIFVRCAEAANVVIFHTNDQHARISASDDNGKSIGLAEITAVVNAERAKNPSTLWLDAGDTFHGLPDINISRGENMVKLLNKTPAVVLAPGNWEYAYGLKQLQKISRELKLTVLSANTVERGNNKNIFKPYKIFKLKNGIKVGVFGLTTPETATMANPLSVKDIEFANPVEAARQMVLELKPKCDIVVGLMHMGVKDKSEFTSERIAREVAGIDVIIDGHSHTEMPQGRLINGTLIAQTGCYENNLGKVELEIEDKKIVAKSAKLLTKDDVKNLGLTPDKNVAETLSKIKTDNAKFLNKILAKSDRTLDWGKYTVRRNEMEICNLVADAFRWKTNADIAVTNGGGVRAGLPAGNVTRGDILKVLPFENLVVSGEISGKSIHEMLEHSVNKYPYPFRGFLQVSGMTFDLDATQPVGQRISNISVGGKALVETQTYTIAATNFLLAGGDGYSMLKDLNNVKQFTWYGETLAEYVEKFGLGNIEVGRINKVKDVMPVVTENTSKEEIRELEQAHVEYKRAA